MMRVESQSIDKSLQQNSVPTTKQINNQILPRTETDEKVVENRVLRRERGYERKATASCGFHK